MCIYTVYKPKLHVCCRKHSRGAVRDPVWYISKDNEVYIHCYDATLALALALNKAINGTVISNALPIISCQTNAIMHINFNVSQN